jgi:hypothetical protein
MQKVYVGQRIESTKTTKGENMSLTKKDLLDAFDKVCNGISYSPEVFTALNTIKVIFKQLPDDEPEPEKPVSSVNATFPGLRRLQRRLKSLLVAKMLCLANYVKRNGLIQKLMKHLASGGFHEKENN